MRIANNGYQRAATLDPGFAEGINLVEGRVTNPAVAESLHLPFDPIPTQSLA